MGTEQLAHPRSSRTARALQRSNDVSPPCTALLSWGVFSPALSFQAICVNSAHEHIHSVSNHDKSHHGIFDNTACWEVKIYQRCGLDPWSHRHRNFPLIHPPTIRSSVPLTPGSGHSVLTGLQQLEAKPAAVRCHGCWARRTALQASGPAWPVSPLWCHQRSLARSRSKPGQTMACVHCKRLGSLWSRKRDAVYAVHDISIIFGDSLAPAGMPLTVQSGESNLAC